MSDELQPPPPGQVTVFSDGHDIVLLGWDGWCMTMPNGIEAAVGIRRMERFAELYGERFDLVGMLANIGETPAPEPALHLAHALGLAAERLPLKRGPHALA